jgi:hypothetical protein
LLLPIFFRPFSAQSSFLVHKALKPIGHLIILIFLFVVVVIIAPSKVDHDRVADTWNLALMPPLKSIARFTLAK